MKHQWYLVSILCAICFFMVPAYAVDDTVKVENAAAASEDPYAEAVVDVKKKPKNTFDKNNDGKIDATDWKQMQEKEKRAYARKLVTDLGQDPDSSLGGLGTREEQYLQGLKTQFEEE